MRRYWLAGVLEVDVDARNLAPDAETLGVLVRLVAPDGAIASEKKIDALPADRQATVEMDVAQLAAGKYVVQAEAIGKGGERLSVSRVDIEKPVRPAWPGTAGISDGCRRPDAAHAAGNAVCPWGVTCHGRSFPACHHASDGVLNGPITLVGSGTGRLCSGVGARAQSNRLGRTRQPGAERKRGLSHVRTVSVEYDGMICSDFSIIPRGECTVDLLALVTDQAQYARYLYHYPQVGQRLQRWGAPGEVPRAVHAVHLAGRRMARALAGSRVDRTSGDPTMSSASTAMVIR